MIGTASWIAFLPIVLGLILGLIAIAFLLWQGVHTEHGFYLEENSLRCPKFHRDVVVTLVRSGPSGGILGVGGCTGLLDPKLVTCGEECIANSRGRQP